jgi:predicted dehydrogenase
MVLRGDEIARQKRLGVMPGTQYRWHPGYQGVIERIRAGHIGEIRAAYAYYNAASPAPRPAKQAGAIWSTNCATGCSTHGFQATSLWSSSCITSM